MLGEDDRHPHSSFRRRSSQISSSPATGSSCEVGSSSRTSARPRDQRRGQRDALQLAAGEGVDGAVEQVRDRQRERDLLDRARARGRRLAAHLQRQLDLRRDRGRDDLGLGVLGDEPTAPPSSAGPVLAGVEAGDLDRARDLAAVEVRDEAAGGAQQGRLAATRSGPARTTNSPARELEVDAVAAPARRRPGSGRRAPSIRSAAALGAQPRIRLRISGGRAAPASAQGAGRERHGGRAGVDGADPSRVGVEAADARRARPAIAAASATASADGE